MSEVNSEKMKKVVAVGKSDFTFLRKSAIYAGYSQCQLIIFSQFSRCTDESQKDETTLSAAKGDFQFR